VFLLRKLTLLLLVQIYRVGKNVLQCCSHKRRKLDLCHAIEKEIENHPVEKAKNIWCYRRQLNKTVLLALGLCAPPNFRYSSKCFAETYLVWVQYENAMLVYLHGTLIWLPGNSVSISTLLWLSMLLIISAEQTSINIKFFTNVLTSRKAQNHEIIIYCSTKLDQQTRSCHAPP